MTFSLTVHFAIVPSHRDAFLELVRENAALSLRDEPGCLRFDVLVAEGDDDQILLYELYTDAAAFDAHLASPHFKSFDQATKDMVVTKTPARFKLIDALDLASQRPPSSR